MQVLSDDLTKHDQKGDVPFNTITTICESPMKFGLIYVGTDDGLIWISNDVGYTWNKISDQLPQGLYTSRVTASAYKEGRVYISFTGSRMDHFLPYIFVSDDFGSTWKQIGNDLPEPVNVVKEDPKNENIVYAGTDNGAYVSLNKGKTFMAMNGELPRVAVHDLVVHPRDNELVLGTHGRSIYIAKLDEVQQLNDSLLQKPLYVFDFSNPTHNKNWGKKSNSFLDAPAGPSVSIPYFAKEKGIVKINIKSEKGLRLFSFTDTAEAGLNYVSYSLEMDSNVVKSFEKSVRDKKKNKIVVMKQADDKKYYLIPGDYTFELTDASGNTISKKFTVTKNKKEEVAEENTNEKD